MDKVREVVSSALSLRKAEQLRVRQPLANLTVVAENTAAVEEALAARELIKISVLQNCMDDPKELAALVGERTRSQVVQVIGKKIVLYKEGKDEKKKIELPR